MTAHPIIRQVVDRLHVSASGRDVVRALYASFQRDYRTAHTHKAARKRIYRAGLMVHESNRRLYAAVARGL